MADCIFRHSYHIVTLACSPWECPSSLNPSWPLRLSPPISMAEVAPCDFSGKVIKIRYISLRAFKRFTGNMATVPWGSQEATQATRRCYHWGLRWERRSVTKFGSEWGFRWGPFPGFKSPPALELSHLKPHIAKPRSRFMNGYMVIVISTTIIWEVLLQSNRKKKWNISIATHSFTEENIAHSWLTQYHRARIWQSQGEYQAT